VDTLDLHARLATAVVLYLAALGLWGVLLGVRGYGPSPSYRGALIIVEVAIAAQGLLGILTWMRTPPPWIHVLYGLALISAIPLAATVVRQGSPRRTSLTLGLASLFAMGLAIRGITTS
jgi:hypothetical protein